MEKLPEKRSKKKAFVPEPFAPGAYPLDASERGTRTFNDALADFTKNVEEREAEKRRRIAHESMRRTEGLQAADETYGPVRE